MVNRRIELIKADITTVDAEAVVNAANQTLLGGGGVDGAIHRTAGPALLEECRKLNGCRTGEAKITAGYGLKAGYIIHTVGPVWRGGKNNENQLLASAYRSCFKIACEKKIRSIAFPGISTGVYGFPKDKAAIIALDETQRFLKDHDDPEKVIFVSFSDEDYEIYRKLLER
jgi:O-acetyl-ADP-ribose deacetylase